MVGDGLASPHHRSARLDGVRGLATLGVVWFHLTYYFGLMSRAGSGYLGVVVFFVLSGYLITSTLWSARGTSHRYGSFVARRVTRLYPALTGLAIFGTLLLSAVGPDSFGRNVRYALIALSQTTGLVNAFATPVSLPWGPTWSLTVEWTFYLLWPIAVIAARSRRLTPASMARMAGVLAVCLYLSALPLDAGHFYGLPVANLGAMLCGAALALHHAARDPADISTGRDPGVALLALGFLVVLMTMPGPGAATAAYRFALFPSAIIAALIIVDQRPGTRGVSGSVLESRPLRTVGLYSYSTYLWHVPLMWAVWVSFPELSDLVRAGTALLLIVPVVVVSFYWLERPWLNARREPAGYRPREA